MFRRYNLFWFSWGFVLLMQQKEGTLFEETPVPRTPLAVLGLYSSVI